MRNENVQFSDCSRPTKNIDMQNIFAKFFIPFVILAFMILGCKKGISYIWNLIK